MRHEITIPVRRFPVTVRDGRTGQESVDSITLSKAELQAARLVGQSSTELIYRLYNRQGYKVLSIGEAVKSELHVDLSGQ